MPDNDDWLEEALNESEPYIDNEDFSRSVMRALPLRKRRTRISPRKKMVAAAGLLGMLCSLPFLSSAIAVPEVRFLLSTQWFLTVFTMIALTGVALVSWWMLAVKE
jgi:hypothetical protein